MDIGGEVLDDINNLGEVTILAPSNEAWNVPAINNIIRYLNRKLLTNTAEFNCKNENYKKLLFLQKP